MPLSYEQLMGMTPADLAEYSARNGEEPATDLPPALKAKRDQLLQQVSTQKVDARGDHKYIKKQTDRLAAYKENLARFITETFDRLAAGEDVSPQALTLIDMATSVNVVNDTPVFDAVDRGGYGAFESESITQYMDQSELALYTQGKTPRWVEPLMAQAREEQGLPATETPDAAAAAPAEVAPLELERLQARDRRELAPEELVSDRALDELGQSSFGDDPFAFAAKVDQTGVDAQKDALSYWRDIMDNKGEDATSKAILEGGFDRAEQERSSNVSAALADLEERGLRGGAQAFAASQGAAKSMASKYQAALQAQAANQQRADGAGVQLATGGYNLRNQQFTETAHAAGAIDAHNTNRANLAVGIDQVNANRHSVNNTDYENYSRGVDAINLQQSNSERTGTYQASTQEQFAKNREAAALLAQRMGLDAQQEAQFLANVMNAPTIELQQQILQQQIASAQQAGIDVGDVVGLLAPVAGAVVGGLVGGPVGAAAGTALGSAAGALAGGVPNTSAAVPVLQHFNTPYQAPTAVAAPAPAVTPSAGGLNPEDF